MKPIKYIKSLLMAAASFAAFASHAQEAATPAAPAASSPNESAMYLLLGIGILLLIAIAVLGQVLVRMTIYVYEHKGQAAKALMLVLLMAAGTHGLMAADALPTAAGAAAPAAAAVSGGFSLNFLIAMCVLLLEVFVIFVMLIRILSLINVIHPKTQAQDSMKFALPRWFDNLNKSVAIEHEKDVMLDHDYDGIKELDNQLPPWWKWGFVFTIIWAVGYLSYYHVFAAAPLSAGEYENEMAEAKIAKDAYMKTVKNKVDENTIVFEASYVPEGQKIFAENCAVCHGDKAEGKIGPNLTDNYWLHGGKINDVFKTVKYGWPDKGMKSWQADLTAIQIAQVVCYVKSLKGTNPPNAKAPQGDLYVEDGSVGKDSAATTASAAPRDTVSK